MRYFRLVTGLDQWVLGPRHQYADGSPVEDMWAYSTCKAVDECRPVPMQILGQAECPHVDFNHTTYGAIVVSRRLGDLLRSFQPCLHAQYLPAEIKGAIGEWEVLNILSEVACMDRRRSQITDYFPENHTQPFKRGKPSSVITLVVDPEQAEGHDLFRVTDWEVAVIASQRLKEYLEDKHATGVQFWPV